MIKTLKTICKNNIKFLLISTHTNVENYTVVLRVNYELI